MRGACWFFVIAVVAFLTFLYVELLSSTFQTVGLGASMTSYTRVDCAPPPPSLATNRSAFVEDLLPLLAALPAAAAPVGFASLQSGGAFVRGQCLGFNLDKDCHACLAAAAENLTSCFFGSSRRGAVWRGDGCFVAYADTNTSSVHEDAFRDVVLAGEDPGEGPNCFDQRRLVVLAKSLARRGAADVLGVQVDRDATALARRDTTRKNTVRVFPDIARVPTTVRVLAQCAWDHAAGCARCLGDAARQVPLCSWGLDGRHERVAHVLGYNCFLRIEASVPLQFLTKKTWPSKSVAMAFLVLALLSTIAAAIAVASEAGYLPAVNAAAN